MTLWDSCAAAIPARRAITLILKEANMVKLMSMDLKSVVEVAGKL